MRKTVATLALVGVVVGVTLAEASDDATETLLRGLRDESSAVRSMAAMKLALGKGQVPREAVSALATALGDRNLNVRYWAASALKRLGREAAVAVPELRRALKTFPGGEPALEGPQRYFADVRAVAAETLGSMGAAAREALPDLQEATQDQNVSVRDAASKALKAIAP